MDDIQLCEPWSNGCKPLHNISSVSLLNQLR